MGAPGAALGATGCGRSHGTRPTRAAAGGRAARRRVALAGSTGDAEAVVTVDGRTSLRGASAAVQRRVDPLRRRARMGGAAVLPALPAARRPLRRRGCQRRRLLDAGRARASRACASPRSSPSRRCARTCVAEPGAERPVDPWPWWTPPSATRPARQPSRCSTATCSTGWRRAAARRGRRRLLHHGARHHARRAGRRRSAGADQDRRGGLRAARHARGATAARDRRPAPVLLFEHAGYCAHFGITPAEVRDVPGGGRLQHLPARRRACALALATPAADAQRRRLPRRRRGAGRASVARRCAGGAAGAGGRRLPLERRTPSTVGVTAGCRRHGSDISTTGSLDNVVRAGDEGARPALTSSHHASTE